MVQTRTSHLDLRRKAERLALPYPALLAEAERVAAVLAQGVHGRRRAGQGETFWQYRQYHNSDTANQIDWRRSARGDQVFVRENEWEAANTVYLWRDGAAGMQWSSDETNPLKVDRRLADSQGPVDNLNSDIPAFARLIILSDFLEGAELWRERIARLSSRRAKGPVRTSPLYFRAGGTLGTRISRQVSKPLRDDGPNRTTSGLAAYSTRNR